MHWQALLCNVTGLGAVCFEVTQPRAAEEPKAVVQFELQMATDNKLQLLPQQMVAHKAAS